MINPAEKKFIAEHLQDDIRKLALKLKSSSPSDIDVPLVLRQISGRQSVKEKLPQWYVNENILYPEHLPLEQCSSELTAAYKVDLCKGNMLADLTGGFGVDCSFLSRNFQQVFYVERQENLCELAKNNFSVLSLPQIQVVHSDALTFLQKMPLVDCIYLDPARRNHQGNKMVYLSDCEPDIVMLKNSLLEKTSVVIIKLSPMLDITSALQSLPETYTIHVVAVENECKELLFLLKKDIEENTEPRIYTVNIRRNHKNQYFSFTSPEERSISLLYDKFPEKYLYEPNASILKSGGVRTLTKYYPVNKLHPDSHLYTSGELVMDFPGRVFQIERVLSFNKKELKESFKNLAQAHITVRNFPVSVEELRKKTKLKPGGNQYLFATTLYNGKHVLIECVKVQEED